MTNGRRGDWMQTWSGKAMFPLDPREDEIAIEDIATAESCCPRFAGHTRFPYWLALHSIMVAEHCSRPNRPLAHLHDGSEAYLGDMVSPFKHDVIMTPYRIAEGRVQAVLLRALGIPFRSSSDGFGVAFPDEVHVADRRALATEIRDLMADPGAWSNLAEPYPERIEAYVDPWAAKAIFLERWEQYRKEAR